MNSMPMLQKDHMPAAIKIELEKNNIAGCVAVQAEQSETETNFLLQLANNNSFIKGIVGWIDLRSENIEDRLAYFSKDDIIKGWRHILQAEPGNFLTDARFKNGIRSLAGYHYTYDLLIHNRQLEDVLPLVNSFPGQKFVIDHCAKPAIAAGAIKGWAVWLKEIAQHPGVYCKLSGLFTEAKWGRWHADDFKPYFDAAFDLFGCDRIMFGSDWPVLNVSGNYGQWKKLVYDYLLQFNEADQQKVWAKNTIAFYSL
jgi:L-fuconolactonase